MFILIGSTNRAIGNEVTRDAEARGFSDFRALDITLSNFKPSPPATESCRRYRFALRRRTVFLSRGSLWVGALGTPESWACASKHTGNIIHVYPSGPACHCARKRPVLRSLNTARMKSLLLSLIFLLASQVSGQVPTADPPLQVLSQQGPNLSAWVLAPIDRSIPDAIRQNITFLREDLLDEGKTKPQASLEAYRVAYQFCSSLIAALDEREKMLLKAGYRAVQANVITPATNQALEARRNYLMSWPQYEREVQQRNELLRVAEATDRRKVELVLQELKIEWSKRTEPLRANLDTLYVKFRATLRESGVTSQTFDTPQNSSKSALPVRYRHRTSEASRLAAIKQGGGTSEVEAAVIRSLDHFNTIQNTDGSWGSHNKGGMTGFVLQCFLGHGEGVESSAYGDAVMKGLIYLIELGANNPHGILCMDWQKRANSSTYEHAIATCALGEAYVVSRSGPKAIPGLCESFEKAIQLIIAQQNKRGSWTYGGNVIAYNAGSNKEDLSLSQWHFLALQVARESGLAVQGLEPCIQKAISYIESKQTKDGGFGTTSRDNHYNQWMLTGGALAGLQYLRKPADHSAQVSNAVKFLTGFLAAEPPKWDKNCNLYSWFGYAEALILSGDQEWKHFAAQVMPQIVAAQNADGAFKTGRPNWPAAHAAETTYRQALCTLILETFYRCPMK